MKVQRCKGTRDLYPAEMRRFRLIEEIFRECCLKRGYGEVRTPTLEYLYLFTSTGTLTPSMLGKVYSFLDWDGWSGERVVLRPDGTIPVARLYIDSMADKELAKLFYVANVFAFEETGKETRERWQCGAELIGPSSTIADGELIILALEVLKKLGLENVELRLSHAGVIRALLSRLGLSPEEQHKLFDRILDGDEQALAGLKSERPELEKVLASGVTGKSPGFLRNLKSTLMKNIPQAESALNDFINIADLLEALGYDYRIDLASGRGFEYYTGVIFHLFLEGERIGGGGRYDALIPLMGGKDIPASGFALYIDPILNRIKPGTLAGHTTRGVLVKVEPDRKESVKEGFNIAKALHDAGYVAEVYLGGEEPADLRWELTVQSKAPQFVLTDRLNKKRFEAQTVGEVLVLLARA
jgi:histidyl-tRNA synthetase